MSARLVILSPNWLGDAVMALPAIHAFRAKYPAGAVDVAARPGSAPLFSMVGGVGVAVLERGREAAILRERRYDAAVLLPNSFASAFAAKRAGIGERWGYGVNFRSWLLTRAVAPRVRVHQVEHYAHLADALGFPPDTRIPGIEIDLRHREDGAARLAAEGWDRRTPLVALAPGAAFGTAKRWPAASFAAIADRIADAGGRAVLLGGPADRAATDEVEAMAQRQGMVNLAGKTDLPMLMSVRVHTRGLVTNDSGPMHLAAALGLPVTAMFGPTREHETHPVGSRAPEVLVGRAWCRPCMLRDCPLTHRCMTSITPDSVWARTSALLS